MYYLYVRDFIHRLEKYCDLQFSFSYGLLQLLLVTYPILLSTSWLLMKKATSGIVPNNIPSSA